LDAERQIRFLYPPIFFVASLFLGIRLDDDVTIRQVGERLIGPALLSQFSPTEWGTPGVALATAGGLVATIALGFLISSVTIFVLSRIVSPMCRSGSYEAPVFPNADEVRRQLRVQRPPNVADDAVFLSATIDHEVIGASVHGWIFRRWTMFYMYAHSATALLLALIVGLLLGIWSCWWVLVSMMVGSCFIPLALDARRDTMGMVTFQAQRVPFPIALGTNQTSAADDQKKGS
jgi:hypothetical protein